MPFADFQKMYQEKLVSADEAVNALLAGTLRYDPEIHRHSHEEGEERKVVAKNRNTHAVIKYGIVCRKVMTPQE